MTLWDKGKKAAESITAYTVGNDTQVDQILVPYDLQASLAHAKMLHKIDVLTDDEYKQLAQGLQEIKTLHEKGQFIITKEQEDMHTAIEEYLTKIVGDVGKKVHTARSRNDQVLGALSLFSKEKLALLKEAMHHYKKQLQSKQSDVLMPGYTHTRKAMPMSVNMWLGCYIEAVDDSMTLLKSVQTIMDKNPLGTGAGFGIPMDIDTSVTTKELGFKEAMQYPLYAQHARGKYALLVLQLCTQIMLDLNKLASDLIFFTLPQLGYVTLPQECCTGSSIMPQKQNPDVLELVRANYHVVAGLQMTLAGINANLISGYHRDLQLTKEPLMKALNIAMDSVQIMAYVVSKITINKEKCKAAMTPELYATQDAYKLVKQGVPFREAYKHVGKQYAKDKEEK